MKDLIQMEEQNSIPSSPSQDGQSREVLEQHLRARAWKDETFRQEFLTNPKAILERDYAQFLPGGKIPSDLSLRVVEEEEQSICFVLPSKVPEDVLPDMGAFEDEELSAISGGGVTDYGTCWSCDTCARCSYHTCRCAVFPDIRRIKL
jgi:hypothetical protein